MVSGFVMPATIGSASTPITCSSERKAKIWRTLAARAASFARRIASAATNWLSRTFTLKASGGAVVPVAMIALWLITTQSASGHQHWINNHNYKSESGQHCCDHRSSNGDCDEIDPETVKPTPDGQGYMTPKGRVSGRSTYISEDGKTYLCSPPNGPPRCLFIRSGG